MFTHGCIKNERGIVTAFTVLGPDGRIVAAFGTQVHGASWLARAECAHRNGDHERGVKNAQRAHQVALALSGNL